MWRDFMSRTRLAFAFGRAPCHAARLVRPRVGFITNMYEIKIFDTDDG